MRKVVMLLILCAVLAVPVRALDITAPEVPESGSEYMPENRMSFGEALVELFQKAVLKIRPDLKEASKVCLGVAAAVMVVSVVRSFSGMTQKAADLAGCAAVGTMLLQSAGSMIRLGAATVEEISEYGKLLLPVMTTALAAQGGVTSGAAIYAGTAVFDSLLCGLIKSVLTPLVYLFLALSIAGGALGEEMLKKLQETLKSVMVWVLKTILYVFTGYIGITGVVSGTTDAAALKAAKLTISGVVPVVGGILSDASEAVLVSAGTVKNAAGIYGMLAILSIWIGPFLKIGSHYLLLKATAALCGVFGSKSVTDLIGEFSAAMGLLLAMTGAVCLMLMISVVCFMKGVG